MENIFDEVVAGEDYKLLFAVVQRGFSDEVVQASRDNGGSGAVILQGKGTTNEKRKFFGFNIEPEKEVVMILVPSEKAVPITKAIYQAVDYKSEARGLVFVLPVSYVSGMSHSKFDIETPIMGERVDVEPEDLNSDKEPEGKE